MQELAMHILDIVENSTRAGSKLVLITIRIDTKGDVLTIDITDDGSGMDKEELHKALDPFYTSKKVRRIGLGLPMLSQAACQAGGTLTVKSEKGHGTRVVADFTYSHVDRQPLGNIIDTVVTIIAGSPEVDFVYTQQVDDKVFTLDTREIKHELDDVPINHAGVLQFLKNNIKEGLEEIGSVC